MPIDGYEVLVASQVVTVCESKNKAKSLSRLAINYKSTINDHLEDIPHVHTSCNSELDKLKGEYRTCIDLKGAFKQIPVTPEFSQKICATSHMECKYAEVDPWFWRTGVSSGGMHGR